MLVGLGVIVETDVTLITRISSTIEGFARRTFGCLEQLNVVHQSGQLELFQIDLEKLLLRIFAHLFDRKASFSWTNERDNTLQISI